MENLVVEVQLSKAEALCVQGYTSWHGGAQAT